MVNITNSCYSTRGFTVLKPNMLLAYCISKAGRDKKKSRIPLSPISKPKYDEWLSVNE